MTDRIVWQASDIRNILTKGGKRDRHIGLAATILAGKDVALSKALMSGFRKAEQ
jgi:hypothetical protein